MSKRATADPQCVPRHRYMSEGFQAPKSRPEEVVAQVLRAIEAGAEEVLVDERTRTVKGGLSVEQSPYLKAPA